jgi:hypothetical protein
MCDMDLESFMRGDGWSDGLKDVLERRYGY